MKKPNRLIKCTSPYLQQHALNPVDWYPWGDEALNRARSENKLIFLSIGYSSCHWCHVMERESFEDETIAAVLNENFISIKVDREERPDLDAIYMEAVQMMSGHGGWPLNIWLTPELIPLYGGTYFPPVSKHNLPSFRMVLDQIQHFWETEPEKIKLQTTRMLQALKADLSANLEPSPVSIEIMHQAFESGKSAYDPEFGGFGPAPKFPSAMYLCFLLRYHKLTGNTEARDMAIASLRAMCLGGIYDQIGGGFHRYSTDRKWLVPHFEKMLYDNALLLSALTEAWQISQDPMFEEGIHRTTGFIFREMMHPDGGFYSAIDADSEGVEGKFYVWHKNELAELLGSDFTGFSENVPLDESTTWEDSIILTRNNGTSISEDVTKKIMFARDKRERPLTDTKILTSWNSMMLKSLCEVYLTFGWNHVLSAITKNAAFLHKKCCQNDRVLHMADGDDGFCDDYAHLAESFGYVFQVTGEEKWIEFQGNIIDAMVSGFYDRETGSFFYTKDSQPDVLVRKKDYFDNAVPSGNSAALNALNRYGRISSDRKHDEILERGLALLHSIAGKYGQSFGYFLSTAAEYIGEKSELILSSDHKKELLRTHSRFYDPFRLTIAGNFENPVLLKHLKGKKSLKDKPTAWYCKNYSCLSPVHTSDELMNLLKTM